MALSSRVFALLFVALGLSLAAIVLGVVAVVRSEAPLGLGLWIALGALTVWTALTALTIRWIFRPYGRVQRVLFRFLEGQTVEELFALPTPLTPEMPQVLEKLSVSLDRQTQLRNAMKQAEYLALQNQINPHFLYNTLEAIRGDALLSGMQTIVDVAEALAIYFRYTISRVNQLVTLADELRNAESYFAIQKYRYGDRLDMRIQYDPEDAPLLDCHLPKLTLQPIIENAITHGLEPKVQPGLVRIRFEGTASRLLITISDNGVGVSPAELDTLLERLARTSPDYIEESYKEGGIALLNVNNRIRLLFGEQYGLTMHSTQGLGTDVIITLPRHYEGGRI